MTLTVCPERHAMSCLSFLCNLSGLSVRSPALLVPQERMDFRVPQVERALQVREGLQGELDLQESQGNKGSQVPLVT